MKAKYDSVAPSCSTMPTMTPDALRRLLEGSDFEAAPAFRALLNEADTALHPDTESHPTPTTNLLTIYRRRAEHVRSIDLPSLGFDETVEKLAATHHERLVLMIAMREDDHRRGVAFLSEDLTELVAAVVILGPPDRSDNQGEPTLAERIRQCEDRLEIFDALVRFQTDPHGFLEVFLVAED